jgi:hypothetical protein
MFIGVRITFGKLPPSLRFQQSGSTRAPDYKSSGGGQLSACAVGSSSGTGAVVNSFLVFSSHSGGTQIQQVGSRLGSALVTIRCGTDVATGRIDAMMVSPSHFRQGIGRAMMQHLENIARDFGVQLLTWVSRSCRGQPSVPTRPHFLLRYVYPAAAAFAP